MINNNKIKKDICNNQVCINNVLTYSNNNNNNNNIYIKKRTTYTYNNKYKLINNKIINKNKQTSISINTSTSNKTNKKKIYNNKKQVCINNVLTYYKYISNTNYNTILYLMFKKNYTYRYELEQVIGNNTWKYYFSRLLKDGIIKPYKLTPDEDTYLVWRNKTGRYQIDNSKYYTLTDEFKELLDQKEQYDLLVSNVCEEVEDYVLDYKTKLKVSVTKHNYLSVEDKLLKDMREGIINPYEEL